jgi:hypothetical protein
MTEDIEVRDLPRPPIYTKKRFIISISAKLLGHKKNDYRYAKIAKLISPRDFEMDDTFFGGNIYTIAKLKDEPYYLLVNKFHQALGLCLRVDELNNFSKNVLLEWAGYQKIQTNKDDTKQSLIDKLTTL